MPRKPYRIAIVVAVLGAPAGLVGWRLLDAADGPAKPTGPRVAAVAVAPIERRKIVDRRVFSGTLVARAEFIVAPKVAGRVESLHIDVGDPVVRGGLVATLDDDEFVQAEREAAAALEVTKAAVAVAQSGLEIATSELERVTDLNQREISSAAELDVAAANRRGRSAQVTLAEAEVQRAEAALETRRVRLRYTLVDATWPGTGDEPRIVAARHVDSGANVAANDPLVTVVDLSAVRAVLHVTERDYARLAVGQPAAVRTDAYPGQVFSGRVQRLAPVFEESSRQARVEVWVDNPDRRLKAGMYVRVGVQLATADDAVVVPVAALVRRDQGQGVFVVVPGGTTSGSSPAGSTTSGTVTVRFVAVELGIVAGDHVQVFGEGFTDRVVVLGQQLIEDGAPIHIPAVARPAPAARVKGA